VNKIRTPLFLLTDFAIEDQKDGEQGGRVKGRRGYNGGGTEWRFQKGPFGGCPIAPGVRKAELSWHFCPFPSAMPFCFREHRS